MGLRELFFSVSKAWPKLRSGKTVDRGNAAYQLVVNEIPNSLQALIPRSSPLKVEGSVGLGNVAAAPWIATFHPEITASARDGFYPVYLFSADLERVYLSLSLGVTQFERQYGRSIIAIRRINGAAERARRAIDLPRIPQRLSSAAISIWNEDATWLSRGYEAASILAFPQYEIRTLPSDEQLKEDFLQLNALYEQTVADPTFPSVEELFLASVPKSRDPHPLVSSFQPRGSERKGGENRTTGSKRTSKAAKKIGDAGEKLVAKWEQKKLIQLGRRDLADKVTHHAAKNEHPGWDITSFDENGKAIYIEVKSSVGKSISSIEVTANEWAAATAPTTAENYKIYLVTKVFSGNPEIEVLERPSTWVASKKLRIVPSVYNLSLAAIPKATD